MVFREIITRIKNSTGLKQWEIAEQVFDISGRNLTNKIKRNSIDVPKLIKWATEKNIDLHWLLTGEEHVETFEGNPSSNITHLDIIQQFKNKNWAKNINQKLVELEKLDPSKRDVVMAYIDGMLNTLRSSEAESEPGHPGADKRKKERRAAKNPVDNDQRNGVDRRRNPAVNE